MLPCRSDDDCLLLPECQASKPLRADLLVRSGSKLPRLGWPAVLMQFILSLMSVLFLNLICGLK